MKRIHIPHVYWKYYFFSCRLICNFFFIFVSISLVLYSWFFFLSFSCADFTLDWGSGSDPHTGHTKIFIFSYKLFLLCTIILRDWFSTTFSFTFFKFKYWYESHFKSHGYQFPRKSVCTEKMEFISRLWRNWWYEKITPKNLKKMINLDIL